MAENNDDFVSSLRTLIQSELVDLNTSIHGTIVSYENGFATVKPSANKLFQDGDSLPFPDIPNVPIRWPSFNGGLCGIKGPIRSGDKVLIVFSQQAIDGTDDMRRHDLTDAYAVPCGNDLVGQATNNEDMIMWFGNAFIRITASGFIEINAPGGSKLTSPSNQFTGNNIVNGNQITDGTTTNTGLTSMNGGFDSTGQARNNGKDIGSAHKHSGVQSGGALSGPVV